MRFAHLHREGQPGPRLALVDGDVAWFLDEHIENAPALLQQLIERGPAELERVRTASAGLSGGEALERLRFDPAVIAPPHILAIGANYAAHANELALKAQQAMTVFGLWPNSLSAHEATVTWPADVSTQVDYEAELGVIIGKAARNVSVRDALDYVWGYTVVNDITARDIQFREAQWSRCKSFDGFTPVGPVVVTADEIPDPQSLWLTCVLDDEIMQDGSAADMIRPVAQFISELSQSATLLPGTLISTGSPGGAGYSRNPQVFLRDGSIVTVTIGGIGSLRSYCQVI